MKYEKVSFGVVRNFEDFLEFCHDFSKVFGTFLFFFETLMAIIAFRVFFFFGNFPPDFFRPFRNYSEFYSAKFFEPADIVKPEKIFDIFNVLSEFFHPLKFLSFSKCHLALSHCF